MKAPFPYFGGKRKVAAQVWSALGDVDQYVEPFAGSLAVLLERPAWHSGNTETINDADQYIANFWRALAHDPDCVAHHADWPVNETDLFSRHLWLVNEGKRQMQLGMESDPQWFDAKIAGWWLWGICAWIGSGWCSGTGPHNYRSLTVDGNAGRGVNRKRPHLGDAGQGVNRQLPHLGDAGQGVNRQLPHLGDAGRGALYAYMHNLAARLRRIRVCCGDWSRIVTNGALNYGSTVGIFLDPPYSDAAERTSALYTMDSLDVAHEVREWCIANGDNLRYRIVLAGYEDEHNEQMPSTWRRMAWTANKSYGSSTSAGSVNDINRHKEYLWFSPACLITKPTLFDTQEPMAGPGR
jgi:DNA adenine methylase